MVLIGQRLVFTSQSHPCHFSWGGGLFASGPKIFPRCLRTKMRTPFAVIKWGTVTKTRSIDLRIINYVLHCVYNIHVSIQINITSINVMSLAQLCTMRHKAPIGTESFDYQARFTRPWICCGRFPTTLSGAAIPSSLCHSAWIARRFGYLMFRKASQEGRERVW